MRFTSFCCFEIHLQEERNREKERIEKARVSTYFYTYPVIENSYHLRIQLACGVVFFLLFLQALPVF